MKKTYTKKQITEAIAYWKKQLKTINESAASKIDGKYLYITKNNPSFAGNVRKIGASGVKKLEDPSAYGEPFDTKLQRYSTCVITPWEPAYAIVLASDYNDIVPNGEKRTPSVLPTDKEIKQGRREGHLHNIAQLEKMLFAAVEAAGSRYGQRELFDIDDATLDDVLNSFVNKHSGLQLIKF